MELPPRTRRIRHSFGDWFGEGGTTSAHAENTRAPLVGGRLLRNYLRARGEYAATAAQMGLNVELPPRTRRIHSGGGVAGVGHGTTSAHAENTCTNHRIFA